MTGENKPTLSHGSGCGWLRGHDCTCGLSGMSVDPLAAITDLTQRVRALKQMNESFKRDIEGLRRALDKRDAELASLRSEVARLKNEARSV